jgi:hypothetical protein
VTVAVPSFSPLPENNDPTIGVKVKLFGNFSQRYQNHVGSVSIY